jgi:hypothetical protein
MMSHSIPTFKFAMTSFKFSASQFFKHLIGTLFFLESLRRVGWNANALTPIIETQLEDSSVGYLKNEFN